VHRAQPAAEKILETNVKPESTAQLGRAGLAGAVRRRGVPGTRQRERVRQDGSSPRRKGASRLCWTHADEVNAEPVRFFK
jgi:hypothetical protein